MARRELRATLQDGARRCHPRHHVKARTSVAADNEADLGAVRRDGRRIRHGSFAPLPQFYVRVIFELPQSVCCSLRSQIQDVIGPKARRGRTHGRQFEVAHSGLIDDVIRDRHRPEVADRIGHRRDQSMAVGAGCRPKRTPRDPRSPRAEPAVRRPSRRARNRSRPLAWRCRSESDRRADSGTRLANCGGSGARRTPPAEAIRQMSISSGGIPRTK